MTILLFILGLVAGSFVGMLTYRLVRGQSLVRPRSRCDSCDKQIRTIDNIPVVSYLFLRGKCGYCGKKISVRYPFVELVTAGLFVGVWYLVQNCGVLIAESNPACSWLALYGNATIVFLLIIVLLLVSIFVIDLEHRIIPDELVFLGFALVVTFLLFFGDPGIYVNIFSGFVAAGFLLFLNLITKGAGMGLGDVKLSVFLGTLFGWPYSIIWLFGAFLTGGFYSFILIFSGKAKLGQHISFGPFLVLSALIVGVFGDDILMLIF